MTNQLANETSPYLLQHANNPVQWFPWGSEALEKAASEDKPIFLSIGYSACHWCHVMEHESFMDDHTAQYLNDHFISIKVDREERPDLDNIYMNAVVSMTGQGGWPMSVFLTPELKPFYGGTYFPPQPRHGLPAFLQVLAGIQQAWKDDRENIENIASQINQHLRETNQWGTPEEAGIQKEVLEQAANALIQNYDHAFGGWGRAPKFPQPMAIDFLTAQSHRGNQKAVEIVRHALDVMQRGGLYDVVAGGFHRYSTDSKWLVPHFEKMLYDNALLALAYLHGYQITGNHSYRRTTTQTLDFIQNELTNSQGGFYSSLDADSEGEEGKYYVWSLPELQSLVSEPAAWEVFSSTYALPEEGNFEGRLILQRKQSEKDILEFLGLTSLQYYPLLDSAHASLAAQRKTRVPPHTDEKILVSWNALALRAFAEAASALQHPGYLRTAQTNATFLLDNLYKDGQLYRTWRFGTARINAFLEDYAALAVGLIHLYMADHRPVWFQAARELITTMVEKFLDPAGGFSDTQQDSTDILMSPKYPQDNATPSGNAMAVYALLLVSALNEDHQLHQIGLRVLTALQKAMSEYPTAFSYWLQALDFAIGPVRQISVVWPEDKQDEASQWLRLVRSNYHPRQVISAAQTPLIQGLPGLLNHRVSLKDQVTGYICQDFYCRQPVTSLATFEQMLSS